MGVVSTRVLYIVKRERGEQIMGARGPFLKSSDNLLDAESYFEDKVFLKRYSSFINVSLKLHLYNFTGKFALKTTRNR